MSDDFIKSEWNQAEAYMRRLDYCCVLLNEAKARHDFEAWKEGLFALYMELVGLMKEDERQEAEKLIQFAENAIIASIQPANTFKRFLTAEKYLRIIIQKKGLLVPMKDDPRTAMMNSKSYG